MRRLTGAIVSTLTLLLVVQQAAVAETTRAWQGTTAPGPLPAPRAEVGPTTSGMPRRTTTLTPAFRAVAAVPDLAEVKADFELRRTGRAALTLTRTVRSGAAVTVLPADFGLDRLEAGAGYSFRARLRAGERVSPWSGAAEVTAGTITTADLVKSAARPQTAAAATTTTTATAEATVTAAAPVAVTSPQDGAQVTNRVTLAAKGTAGPAGATFQYRRGESDTWKAVPAADVTRTDGTAVTWPVAVTNGSSTPVVWNAAKSLAEDGTISVRGVYTGSIYSDPVEMVLDRDAGAATTSSAGPGQVNLLTGDYALDAQDVSAFGAVVTRAASSRHPDLAGTQAGQAPIFGPQWSSGVVTQQTLSDYTGARQTSATSVQLTRVDGGWVDFTRNADGTWTAQPGSEYLTLTGTLTGALTLTTADAATTTFAKGATGWQVSATYLPSDNSATKVVSETSSGLVRPRLIIGPTTAVPTATCETAPQTKGCRVLEFVYATATTATSSVPGDYTGRVKQLRQWATDPGAAAATAVVVAAYAYDTSGRLVTHWDPRITPSLRTAYAYDAAGRVSQLTPPGELPFTFTYDADGALLKASRPTLKQGSRTETAGVADIWLVYDVPLTGDTAPYQLGADDVDAWGQVDAAVTGTAIFPSGPHPDTHDGTQVEFKGDYWYAGVSYLNAAGHEVNNLAPGYNLSVTEYDSRGNPVRNLTARNRELATSTPEEEPRLVHLGLADVNQAVRADLLSTVYVYSDDGQRELERFGPLHAVSVPGGAWLAAREHTVTEYDAGRPDTAKVSGLPTKVTVGAAVPGEDGDRDTRTTTTAYNWSTGQATSTAQDPAGLNIVRTTAYDGQGRVTETKLPSGAATTTTYWSATGTGMCAGLPEWADLACRVSPAGAPVKITEYNRYGQPAKITETSGTTTRTSTFGYDAAGRAATLAITGGLGTAVPTQTVTYDQATGRTAKVSGGGSAITTELDALGRRTRYDDGRGGVTTTEYDALDRPVKVSDNVPSSTTYVYDVDEEPRGLPISMTDSVAGTFTATYDSDGMVDKQTLPGGVTYTSFWDEAGNLVERDYRRTGGELLLYDWVDASIHDQWVSRTGTGGGWQDYTYDAAGRLTMAQDSTDTTCARRDYTYDRNSNRTSSATAGSCASSGATTAYAYDAADRLTATGYVYDGFGRTTATPDSTFDYYANNLVNRQTTGSARQTWSLDAAGRLAGWTTETRGADGVWQQSGAKAGHYGAEGDRPSWIAENGSGTVTRFVTGLEGDVAASTGATGSVELLLTDLHGDVGGSFAVSGGTVQHYAFDEYGNATGTSAGRYGWLGGQQRSAETPGQTMVMGARLYAPRIGRFLQTDPIRGGSDNAYDYAGQDPLTKADISGLAKRKWSKKWFVRYKLQVWWNRRETKRMRDFWDAFQELLTDYWRFIPFSWGLGESLAAFAWHVHYLARTAVRTKGCVTAVAYVWGWMNASIYHGGYCK
ncbi:RHS repeat protein [Nonomuraea basaltis]|uniref:RHS repeat protein n=1 Tax=Nonomuraea basaltis TaxID=2495887 RepID=UPI00110C660F|nr:RHS repeat-associated core domain-containing protein [Nonomuraea basaltis]TMR94011.1 hypothetical protein EJK15_36125 [Nonomuraea basaltis]